MHGIWLAAMVAGLVAFGVAAQLGWNLRVVALPRWLVRRPRGGSRADDFRNAS